MNDNYNLLHGTGKGANNAHKREIEKRCLQLQESSHLPLNPYKEKKENSDQLKSNYAKNIPRFILSASRRMSRDLITQWILRCRYIRYHQIYSWFCSPIMWLVMFQSMLFQRLKKILFLFQKWHEIVRHHISIWRNRKISRVFKRKIRERTELNTIADLFSRNSYFINIFPNSKNMLSCDSCF